MKAIIKKGPEPGIELVDLPIPEPGEGEILIKVAAAAICGTDMHYYHWNKAGQDFGTKYNIRWPLTLGHECGGTIVKLGPGVTGLEVGQRVALETHIPCGKCFNCQNGAPHNCSNMDIYGTSTNGCFAEYALAPAKVAFVIPDGMNFEQAALMEPAGVAMRAVELCDAKPGETVLVNGCGPFGQLAIMILKAGNAARVIATDLDDTRLAKAASLGAITVNAAKEDAVARVRELCADRCGADAVIECTGAAPAYKTVFDYIRLEGRLVSLAHPGGEIPVNVVGNVNTKGLTWKGVFGRRIWQTWWALSSLITAGKVDTLNVVAARYTLDQCQEAFEHAGSAPGKVIFNIG